MRLRGIIQTAALEPDPGSADAVEMVLRLQGVGPGQPRRIVVPFALLLREPGLEPETVEGHGCEADVEETGAGRWVAREIAVGGGRVLRAQGD